LPVENITPNRDEDLSDEIHALFCQLVDTEREIYKHSIVQKQQIITLFANTFCPDFMALYRYTNAYLKTKFPDDKEINALVEDTYKFLIEIRGTPLSKITIPLVYSGIEKFDKYSTRLTKEKVLKIV
jgi:hypothetical protein